MDADFDTKKFGERVKARRAELKMAQSELAEQLGLTVNKISSVEKGNMPAADTYVKLLAWLPEEPAEEPKNVLVKGIYVVFHYVNKLGAWGWGSATMRGYDVPQTDLQLSLIKGQIMQKLQAATVEIMWPHEIMISTPEEEVKPAAKAVEDSDDPIQG